MFKITRNMGSKRIAVFMDNLYEGMDEEWMEQILERYEEMFKITRNMASKRIVVFMDNLYEGMDEEWMEKNFGRYVE
ncbi:hypothetical protein RHGRI_032230 [Rhododendron griersonianum]|uniref:Uncharacterized protein n=1 Tax=Rhododendron griersonianum TaxID=479676 RepID=A0AAV6IAX8_9ERIC|nr:hypothetical protein RHGRI_032230 [Rhododendron griersonianum]